ncbi:transmembrane protein 81 [Entelurus aequoreus]|uniref:transmembrane protein 81 n=1 Tax=Entelurus aequoreus TaxID=161455 RepID=UPI002B1DDA4C|nr:transmembrane protein 81 [Entelurus aequoreus]
MALVFFLILLFPLAAQGEEPAPVQVQVVTSSTPCSATCGLGVKVQRVCDLKDAEGALEDAGAAARTPPSDVTERCRDVTVTCRESWRCGLKTVTVTTGERVELDCLLAKNAEVVRRLSWRVSWFRARGLITSDDTLFARWHSPTLDLLVLDPVEEEHAGTYRCDVLDAATRRVKKAYWGVRVLPRGVLNLDYGHAESVWDSSNPAVSVQEKSWVIYLMLTLLCMANTAAVLFVAVKVMKNKGSYSVDEDAANHEETTTEI